MRTGGLPWLLGLVLALAASTTVAAPAEAASTGRIEISVRGLPAGVGPGPEAQVYRFAPTRIEQLDQRGRTTIVANAPVGTWNLTAQRVRIGRSRGGAKRGDVFAPRSRGRFSVRRGQTARVTLRFRRMRLRAPLTGATQVSVSKTDDGVFACAVARSAAACWGANGAGQADPRRERFPLKATTVIGSGVTQVSAGYRHACAVVQGAAKCWGENDHGELGSPDRRASGPVTAIAGGVAAVSAGQERTCALMTDGSVRCWGGNDYGALGSASPGNSSQPVVALASGALAVATVAQTSCALMNGGEIRCWGRWGRNDEDDHPVPFTVLGGGATSLSDGPCASIGNRFSCLGYVPSDRARRSGARFGFSAEPVDTGLGAVGQAESSRMTSACGLAGDAVRCIGFSPPLSRRAKTYVTAGARQVSVGDRGACAVVADRVECWGSDSIAGDGTGTDAEFAVPVRR